LGTCDTLTSAFRIFKNNPEEVFDHFLPLKNDEGEFTKRFFVILLMCHYMEEEYIDMTLQHLSEVPQGQYYVDMAIAWALSVGLVKFYDKTLPYLQQKTFSTFVHNKAIQKARESYRISAETKELLNKMKIKR
jgi:3-methyladenine DNA glycosylase AlkD